MDHPKFNFGKVTRQWWRDFERLDLKMMKLSRQIGAMYRQDFSDAEMDAALAAKLALEDEQDGLIAQVLVALPAAWLVDEAPDKIDWSDAASMMYVRLDYRTALNAALLEAVQHPAGKA